MIVPPPIHFGSLLTAGDYPVSRLSPDLVPHLEQLIQERLSNWPPQWEGFHWPGYTYEHTLRVRNLALHLGQSEGADPEVVEVAALLHDICKADGREHAHIGADESRLLLTSLNVDGSLVEQVCFAIDTHSGDNTTEHPAENRALGDADLIDANFGLVATWRFITIRAGRASTLEDTVSGMAEWLPKKDELMELLRTKSGLEVARERSATMHSFCREIVEVFASATCRVALVKHVADPGLRKLVEYMASDYHRASLQRQLPTLRAQACDDRTCAVCARLEREMAGEV